MQPGTNKIHQEIFVLSLSEAFVPVFEPASLYKWPVLMLLHL